MLWVVRKAGIAYPDYLGMRFEKLGQLHCVFLGLLDPEGKSAQPPQDEPCLVGVHRCTEEADDLLDAAVMFFGFCYDHPSDHVGMAIDELGQAVNDDIGAKLNRPLEVWACKSIIYNQKGPVFFRDRRRPGQVGDFHAWIHGRFDEKHSGRRANGFLDVCQLRAVHKRGFHSIPGKLAFKNHTGGTVKTVRDNDMISPAQKGYINRTYGRHTSGGRHSRETALQHCDAFLKGINSWIIEPAVYVSGLLSGKSGGPVGYARESKRRALKYRDGYFSVYAVFKTSGMNGFCGFSHRRGFLQIGFHWNLPGREARAPHVPKYDLHSPPTPAAWAATLNGFKVLRGEVNIVAKLDAIIVFDYNAQTVRLGLLKEAPAYADTQMDQ